MDSGLISVTGIVVGQLNNYTKFYVWCQESYHGKDGILTLDVQKPLTVGKWVNLKFTPSEFQTYFPNPKNPDAPQFHNSNYTPKPDMFNTIVEGKTIKIRLELSLVKDQREICHKVFGKIYNNRKLTFETGDHMVTIKRVIPKPYMDSVWVMENIDQLPSETELIGIVGGSDSNFWYVWTKERPVGQDITIKKEGATVTLGSWVRVTVPRDKVKTDYYLECLKYTVIPMIHDTEVVFAKTIKLSLQGYLDSGNSTVIQHSFVGDIINEKFEITKNGLFEIRIVRKKPKQIGNGVETVWFLDGEPKLLLESTPTDNRSRLDQSRENVIHAQPTIRFRSQSRHRIPATNVNSDTNTRPRSQSRPRTPATSELTGIIVAENMRYFFVWCKERVPGFDVTIKKCEKSECLDLTDFVKFTVSEEQKVTFFDPKTDGFVPDFEISEYRKIPAQFHTYTGGHNKSTIHMDLEVDILTPIHGDFLHDFVGLILNSEIFETEGKYKITIYRYKNQHRPRSVWNLKTRELIPQNLTLSMETLNLEPTLKPILKYSRLQNQRNRLGSQSENCLNARNVPGPAPIPVRQESPATPPVPAPRTSLDCSPTQNGSIRSKAIVLNIVPTNEGKEDIHVWIFQKLKQGFLNLQQQPAENLGLGIGSVFEAEFVEQNGRWKTFEVEPGSIAKLYETRNQKCIEVLVYGAIGPAGKVNVDNFGDIQDVNNFFASDFNASYPFWIRRSKTIDGWVWTVVGVEQNNANGLLSNGLLPP